MKGERPYTGVRRSMALDGLHHERQGKAKLLYEALVDWQTDPEGNVNYGRAITYEQIAKRMTNAPSVDKLRKWMRRLREFMYVETKTVYRGCSVVGMKVKVLNSGKWANQMKLFRAENVVAFGQGASTKLTERSTRAVGGALAIQGGGSSAVERGPTRAEVAGSNPAPRSKGLRAGESRGASMLENQRQKAARLEREIQTIFGNYPGTLDLPEHTERKLRELTRELGITRELIREYELGLGQKAGCG